MLSQFENSTIVSRCACQEEFAVASSNAAARALFTSPPLLPKAALVPAAPPN